MTDSDKKPTLGRRPLGLKTSVEAGEVKQTFSHGRTNKVVVEVKRRKLMGRPGETAVEAAPAPPPVAPPQPAMRPTPPPPPPSAPAASRETRQELQTRLLREAEEARLSSAEANNRREQEERQRLSDEARRRSEDARRADGPAAHDATQDAAPAAPDAPPAPEPAAPVAEVAVAAPASAEPAPAPDAATIARLSELVMARFERIGEELSGPDGYLPIFDIDARDNEVLWLFWIEGFNRALALRPSAWDPMLEAGSSAQEALAAILAMTAIAAEDCDLPAEDIAEIEASAPDLIGECVEALYAWRTNPIAAAGPAKKGPKVGLNDPCPCGSGKKFKKCCGAA